MTVHLNESGNLLIPDVAANVTTTPTVGAYVNARDCESIELGILMAAGSATSAFRVTLEVMAATSNAGAGAEAVNFETIYHTIGAPAIKAGTGKATKIEQAADDSYTSLAANADKQELFIIPIRTRQLPAGKNWVGLRATIDTTARSGIHLIVRKDKRYGDEGHASLFA